MGLGLGDGEFAEVENRGCENGVGTLDHLRAGIADGHADAVLAASIFHFGEFTVPQAKAYLAAHDIEVRPPFGGDAASKGIPA